PCDRTLHLDINDIHLPVFVRPSPAIRRIAHPSGPAFGCQGRACGAIGTVAAGNESSSGSREYKYVLGHSAECSPWRCPCSVSGSRTGGSDYSSATRGTGGSPLQSGSTDRASLSSRHQPANCSQVSAGKGHSAASIKCCDPYNRCSRCAACFFPEHRRSRCKLCSSFVHTVFSRAACKTRL